MTRKKEKPKKKLDLAKTTVKVLTDQQLTVVEGGCDTKGIFNSRACY